MGRAFRQSIRETFLGVWITPAYGQGAARSALDLGCALKLAVDRTSDDRGHRPVLAAGKRDQLLTTLLIDPCGDERAVAEPTYILAHLHAPYAY